MRANLVVRFALRMALGVFQAHTGGALAQEIGDARNGSVMAQQICSECHAVRRGETMSPHLQAPSFWTVANTAGMNSDALRVWLQSSHRSMPDFALGEMAGEDVIAYILSLKESPAGAPQSSSTSR